MTSESQLQLFRHNYILREYFLSNTRVINIVHASETKKRKIENFLTIHLKLPIVFCHYLHFEECSKFT